MDDPAKNPYAAGSTTPGGRFPAAQGLGTINAAATTGTMIGLSLIGGLVFIGIVGIALQIPTAGKLTSLMEDAKL